MQVCALLLLLTSSLLGSGGKNLSSGIFAKMSSQLLQLKPRKGHENRSKSKQTNKSRWPELQNVTDVKILAKYWGKSLGEHAISNFVKMKPFSGTFTNLCEVSLYKLAKFDRFFFSLSHYTYTHFSLDYIWFLSLAPSTK